MPDQTLTRERIEELREEMFREQGSSQIYVFDLDEARTLLSAAESAIELRDEMRELRRTVAKHHGEAHAAREERDRLRQRVEELEKQVEKPSMFNAATHAILGDDW